MSPKLQEELLSEMARLSQKEQQQVVSFAKSLAAGATGKSRKDLARFAGAIEPDDLKQMAAVIKEGCEAQYIAVDSRFVTHPFRQTCRWLPP